MFNLAEFMFNLADCPRSTSLELFFFFLTVNLHKIKNMTRPNVGEDVVNTHVYALMMHV